MRRFLPFLLAGWLSVVPAVAQETPEPEALTPQAIEALTLDELFEELPANADTPAGKSIEREILERFHRIGQRHR